jgi:hypothetical protein
MPKIDTGPTDGPPGAPVPTAWVTLTEAEAQGLLAALVFWNGDQADGGARPGWHHHITDSDGNELTIAVE